MKYEGLEKLNDLRQKGIITEEEFQREKAKILTGNTSQGPWGMDGKTFCMLMHLSLLLNACGFGWILPIVMWITAKDDDPRVDIHGKIIFNWLLSALIYAMVGVMLVFVIVGIPILWAIGICSFIFPIIAAVKANDNVAWKYPLSIPFFKIEELPKAIEDSASTAR